MSTSRSISKKLWAARPPWHKKALHILGQEPARWKSIGLESGAWVRRSDTEIDPLMSMHYQSWSTKTGIRLKLGERVEIKITRANEPFKVPGQ